MLLSVYNYLIQFYIPRFQPWLTKFPVFWIVIEQIACSFFRLPTMSKNISDLYMYIKILL